MQIKQMNEECYRVISITNRTRTSGERTIIATIGKVRTFIELPDGSIVDSWAAHGYDKKICEIPASNLLARKILEAYQNNYRVYTNIAHEFQEEYEFENGQTVAVYYHKSIQI